MQLLMQLPMPVASDLLPLLAGLLGFATVVARASGPSTALHAAVSRASEAWVEAFNRGDADACAAGYSEDASMSAQPLADLQGRAAIRDFWQGVLDQDPGTLEYHDPKIHVLSDDSAVLSANWSMSRLGSGVITLERWRRQDDGIWRLVEDRFEILASADTSETAAETESNSENTTVAPTFVLVHGAWMGAWAWHGVVEALEAEGKTAVAVNLPAHGGDPTDPSTVTLQDYVDQVVATLDAIDGPVFLVGHSFGGVVVTQAAEARAERLVGLGYICAFLLGNGQSFASATAPAKGSEAAEALAWSADGTTVTIKPERLQQFLVHDIDAEAFGAFEPQLVPQPAAPLTTPLETSPERWGSVPRFYLEATDDQALSLDAQRAMHQRAGVEAVEHLAASHTPMASMPKELAQALLRFAQHPSVRERSRAPRTRRQAGQPSPHNRNDASLGAQPGSLP